MPIRSTADKLNAPPEPLEIDIGFLGAGHMGQTLARLLIGAGHRVQLSNSRGPASLRSIVAGLGSRASAGTPQEVVRASTAVVLATRWEQTRTAVRGIGPWDGKIVIDTTNNRTGPAPDDVIDIGGRTSSEIVAELLPGAHVVKAFNHAPISELSESLGASPSEHNSLFVAGDDRDAKGLVMQLIRDIGGEPFDAGSLREGGALQGTGGPLHSHLPTPTEARRSLEEARADHDH